jgi:signal transduction histidine kinase
MNTDKTVQKLNRLVDISVTLNSTLDLNDLLQLISQAAAEILECDATSILLYDEKRKHLYFAAATGSDREKLAEIAVPIDNSLAGTIFRTNQPLVINDATKDPRHFSGASQHVNFQPGNLLGVPMRIRDKVTGVLEALNKREGEFTAEDQELLSVLASHAAVAINNASLVQELKKAYAKVSEADRLKSSFLALASHELRTPLGIVIGYASFLREDSKEDVSEQAEHVLNAALQMRAVLEDMSNLTLLETDGLTFKPQVVSIQKVLRTVCEETQNLADAKSQEIIFDMPERPLVINADPEKLKVALLNVLNNAIAYSPSGGKITIGALRDGDGIQAWVQDSGIGIAPDQLDKIFREFYQVEQPNTRHYGGLGIGLAIAKGLVEAQRGKIWAESEGLQKGACIKVWFPALGKTIPRN